jgi:hypothetical protein
MNKQSLIINILVYQHCSNDKYLFSHHLWNDTQSSNMYVCNAIQLDINKAFYENIDRSHRARGYSLDVLKHCEQKTSFKNVLSN